LAIYRWTSEISYIVWETTSVIYNVSSGNTFLVENIPSSLMESCFVNRCFDEKEMRQNMASIDEQQFSDALNSFVKMDFLEKVES